MEFITICSSICSQKVWLIKWVLVEQKSLNRQVVLKLNQNAKVTWTVQITMLQKGDIAVWA